MRSARNLVMMMAVVTSALVAAHAEKKSSEFAKVCGVETSRKADGLFAKEQGKDWRQFQKVKEIPDFEKSSGEMAQVWRGGQGSFVQTAAFSSGFARYHEYCFAGDGKLTRLNYEVRSPYGWGYARTNEVKDGELVPLTHRFFGLKSNRTIRRPSEAEDSQWALYPKVYKRFNKLPFAKMIAEQKKEDAQAH